MKNAELVVSGFKVKKFHSVEGKNEEDPGKVQLVLEATKDNVKVLGVGVLTVSDVLGAFNLHQSVPEPVGLKVRFNLQDDVELPEE